MSAAPLRRCARLAAVALALVAGTASAALVPPPGFTAAVRGAGNGDGGSDPDCKAAPAPYIGDLKFPSKYEGSDKARDDLNPKAEQEYERLTSDIRDFEKHVSSTVGRYLRNGDAATLRCALDALDAWAAAGALLGKTQDHTGKSMRKWTLASIASAYARLKFSTSRPLARETQKARRIEAWFARLGDQVVKDWGTPPLAKENNHEYWAAWAVMATAVVLDRRDFFDWAMKHYRIAAKQVDADGYLPNELKRDTRALSYHNYSLGPLAMLAAFAKANGVDVRRDGGPALHRLVARTLAGVDNPKSFEQKTGERQELEDVSDNSKFAWLEAYCWTFACEGATAERLAAMRPLKTTRLGGNVTEIFAPEAARKDTGAAAPTRLAHQRR